MNPALRTAATASIKLQATRWTGLSEFDFVGEVLQDSITDHSRRGNPGLFKLIRLENSGYSVVAEAVRNTADQRGPS